MQRSSEPDELVAIGKITRAVGLEGFCVIDPQGTTLETLDVPCLVKFGDRVDNCADILIEELDLRSKDLICRFKDRYDRDSADLLRGKNIYIKKSTLPSLDQDEFYHFELIGMAVFTDFNNAAIGTITEVFNFPAADTIEIERTNGESLLISLTGESVIKIDKESRKIIFKHSFIEELL